MNTTFYFHVKVLCFDIGCLCLDREYAFVYTIHNKLQMVAGMNSAKI